MPNGGVHHCGHCKHFTESESLCRLRQEKIEKVHWTTCRSFGRMQLVPDGPVYAIICEVASGGGSYADLPYYLGNRPEGVQEYAGSDTNIKVRDIDGKIIEFRDSDEYLGFYEKSLNRKYLLKGAIAGDIIGSRFEFHNHRSVDFELFTDRSHFTDDTVLTLAVAKSLLSGESYSDSFVSIGRRYRKSGYGLNFKEWLKSDIQTPYNSFGNGSAMRVSPVAWAFDTLERVLSEAKESAEVTHNHPEGIKGAQAVAAAIFLARGGSSKDEIRSYITTNFGYNLTRTLDDIRPGNQFDETCQGSVPESITAFLESSDFESAIRLAVSIGGDSDTIACIAGSIAEAFYQNIPIEIVKEVNSRLTDDLRLILSGFNEKYGDSASV